MGGREEVALRRFLDHIAGYDDAWVATTQEIARHWIEKVEPTLRAPFAGPTAFRCNPDEDAKGLKKQRRAE